LTGWEVRGAPLLASFRPRDAAPAPRDGLAGSVYGDGTGAVYGAPGSLRATPLNVAGRPRDGAFGGMKTATGTGAPGRPFPDPLRAAGVPRDGLPGSGKGEMTGGGT
jgi:hypothetical protein